MLLQIYSLRKPLLRREAKSVNLKTVNGELTILDNHRALITFLKKGPIRILDGKDKEETLEAEGGFLEVRPKGEVNILLD